MKKSIALLPSFVNTLRAKKYHKIFERDIDILSKSWYNKTIAKNKLPAVFVNRDSYVTNIFTKGIRLRARHIRPPFIGQGTYKTCGRVPTCQGR